MAQFDLFGSRQGMFMGSFSMVVGVVTLVVWVDLEEVAEVEELGVAEADDLAGWAGPITCSKLDS